MNDERKVFLMNKFNKGQKKNIETYQIEYIML